MGSFRGMEQTRNEKRKRFNAEEKDLVVGLYRESGLSQTEFCRREGIALSNLQRWIARKTQSRRQVVGSTVSLVEVEKEDESEAYAGDYRMGTGKGMWIEFGSGFDAGEVRALAAILREGCGC